MTNTSSSKAGSTTREREKERGESKEEENKNGRENIQKGESKKVEQEVWETVEGERKMKRERKGERS